LPANAAWSAYQILQDAPTAAPTDVAIVLGAAVWSDQPSPVFSARIDYALELLAAGHVNYIIFTGGLGGGDQLAESVTGAHYAIAHGAPSDQLRCETSSNTTWGNLAAAAAIMREEGWHSSTIVSDPLHLHRAMMMAGDLGLAPQPAPTPYTRYRTWSSRLPFLLREIFFLNQYWLQRLLTKPKSYPALSGAASCLAEK
jgi:uncharacterized SAM-binding protein YcdF (DUF218 family)